MSRNNDVFQILVTKGNQSALAAGNSLSDLSPGQIGVFDAETNLSIDGTNPTREFFLAVGVDRDGDGNVDDIVTSSGQFIQTKNIVGYQYRPYVAGKPMIIELTDYTADCDNDYAIKLEFRNQEIYRRQGYVQFTKTYAIRTSCCDTCSEACPSGDANEITLKLVESINADEDGLVTAEAIALSNLTTGTHETSQNYSIGDVMTLEDVQALIDFNATAADNDKVYTKVRLTSIASAIRNYCSINARYYYPRNTVIIASLVDGFGCNGKLTTTQEVGFEQGNGHDVREKEYIAGGWNGRPGVYRVTSIVGLPLENIEYFADSNVKYNMLALTYDQFSIAGWQEHLNHLATEIAIPQADTTTRDSLLDIMDAIVDDLSSGFASEADTFPTISAGDDGAITQPTDEFTVSTATATDADGSIAEIVWSQVGDTPSVATITDGDTLTPTFGDLTSVGTYTFQLTVTDNEGNSVSDTMSVVVSA